MRYKRFLSHAGDACSQQAYLLSTSTSSSSSGNSSGCCAIGIACNALAGPSRLPAYARPPPSKPPPPSIPPNHSVSQQQYLPHRYAPVLSFLYPPSCFKANRQSPLKYHHASLHSSSSLSARRSTSASRRRYSAAANQLAQLDHSQSEEEQNQVPLPSSFTFTPYHYTITPQPLIPKKTALPLPSSDPHPHQGDLDALGQEYEQQRQHASTLDINPEAVLPSIHQDVSQLQETILSRSPSQLDTKHLLRLCRQLVLLSKQAPKGQAELAKAKARRAVLDCSQLLYNHKDFISAANILSHMLTHIGWDTRTQNVEVSNHGKEKIDASTATSSTAASAVQLISHCQDLLSQLTLHKQQGAPRASRGFSSRDHCSAASILMSSMRTARLPKSGAVQSAMMRALIDFGLTTHAVQLFAAEVSSWWQAHKEAVRPRSPQRRQAALMVEIGKPSTQALREIKAAVQSMAHLLGRIQPDLLDQLSQTERNTLDTKRIEYAHSLLILGRLLLEARLPIPPNAMAPEVAWIISACCRFESTVSLHAGSDLVKKRLMSNRAYQTLKNTAHTIRSYLTGYIQTLPSGGPDMSSNTIFVGGEPVVRPPLGLTIYNQLLHYTMAVLGSPATCKEVFQHMTQIRQPPLVPDAVTYNTILRQATTKRFANLATAVLTVNRQIEGENDNPTQSFPTDEMKSSQKPRDPRQDLTARVIAADTASSSNAANLEGAARTRPVEELQEPSEHTKNLTIAHIDEAISQADSYRLVTLLQHVAASGLFLRQFRHEPGHVGVKELVMRIYPSLSKYRYSRSRRHLVEPSTQDRHLRPKVDRAGRLAILQPYVLTATLNLAARAAMTGLTLRVWRLLKRTSFQSSPSVSHSDVAMKPWKIPTEAATILMQLLAYEAKKDPQLHAVVSEHRSRSSTASRDSLRSAIARQKNVYARGWNLRGSRIIGARGGGSLRRNYTGHEGLRWHAARIVAKNEYRLLLHHWGLDSELSRLRHENLLALYRQPEVYKPTVVKAEAIRSAIRPDAKFFDTVLDIFGRGLVMRARGKRRKSTTKILLQLQRGYQKASDKANQLAQSKVQCEEDRGVVPSRTVPGDGWIAAEEDAASSCTHDIKSDPAQSLPLHCNSDQDVSTEKEDTSSLTFAALEGLSTQQLVERALSGMNSGSRGGRTAIRPDPFLVYVLLDMQALGLAIPRPYTWILAHLQLSIAHQLGQQIPAISPILLNTAHESAGRSKKDDQIVRRRKGSGWTSQTPRSTKPAVASASTVDRPRSMSSWSSSSSSGSPLFFTSNALTP